MTEIKVGQTWESPSGNVREVVATSEDQVWMKTKGGYHSTFDKGLLLHSTGGWKLIEPFFVAGRTYGLKYGHSSVTYYIKDILKEGEALFALARREHRDGSPAILILLDDIQNFREI